MYRDTHTHEHTNKKRQRVPIVSLSPNFLRGSQPFLLVSAGEDDARSPPCDGLGRGAPDAGSGAGDDVSAAEERLAALVLRTAEQRIADQMDDAAEQRDGTAEEHEPRLEHFFEESGHGLCIVRWFR